MKDKETLIKYKNSKIDVAKILKEHWNEKLYAVADKYFKRSKKNNSKTINC